MITRIMGGSRCLLLVVILYLSTDSVKCTASFISFESVNLNVYAQYTCTVSNGGTFLRWCVTGMQTPFLFSTSDAVGFTRTSTDDVFFATLTNTTNGLASILSFYVTNKHNGTQIICEDPGDSHSVSLSVKIRDPPSKPDVTLSCINSTCFNVQWTDLSECFLISRYEVSLSNGEMIVTDSGTDVSFCFNGNATIFDITSVTVVAFDNADREGESTVVEIPCDMDIDSDIIFPTSDMNNTRGNPDDYSCDRGCLMAISITFGCTTGGLIILSIGQLVYIVKCPKDVNKINNNNGKPDSPELYTTPQDIETERKPK